MPTLNGYPDPLSEDEVNRLFPLQRPLIKPGVFEMGLVLGGTVSAGAYTGGVIDYLIEALDAWTRAKERGDSDAPKHQVVISALAGTSGGAINGAIITRAAGWEFAHGQSEANPFYTAWTQGVDLEKLLSTAAEPGVGGFASALNCSAIDRQAADTIKYQGQALGTGTSPKQRSYFADPLRLFMMVGNVTGIPYKISLTGQSGLAHELVAHMDYVRFALAIDGGVPDPVRTRPDEFALDMNSAINWDKLEDAALATSAFPLAFRSRELDRPLKQFGYRVAVVPPDDPAGKPPRVVQLIPKWEILASGYRPPYDKISFVNVDGGTMNNEPIDVVRTALAGYGGRNKRDGALADRAVVLIDPFSDPEKLGPTAPPGVLGLIFPFVMALVYQNRMKPVDVALANDPETYSRYLVAPYGPGPGDDPTTPISGSRAIASGGIGGFLGFVDRGFLQYDYLLGRRNAYEFLTKELFLPEENPLFNAPNWTQAQRTTYQRQLDQGSQRNYLPIIPLMRQIAENPPPIPDPWPKLKEFPNRLSDLIEARLDSVYQAVKSASLPDTWWKRAAASTYLWLGWKAAIRSSLRDAALGAIKNGLTQQALL